MNPALLEPIFAHAEACAPAECCGLIVEIEGQEQYVPCKNIAGEDRFEIDGLDWIKAEDSGNIKVVVHSHYNQGAMPSPADMQSCENHGKPWLIVSWPEKLWHYFEPSGYKAPLLGRPFVHGIHDCYAVIRDYYREKLGIEIPNFERKDNWWMGVGGPNLYVDNFKAAGFVEVPKGQMREHDGLLMQWTGRTIHHAAVYLGNERIIHHLRDNLSREEFYGQMWQRCTRMVVRHKSLQLIAQP